MSLGCGLYAVPAEMPIVAGGGGGGEVNTASNVGTGKELFKVKTGVDLAFRSLTAGTNISLVQNADDIVINATGGIANGTGVNNTLYWDGSNWVENSNLKNYGVSGLRITGVTSTSLQITQTTGADPLIISAGATTRYASFIDNTSGSTEWNVSKGGNTYQVGDAVIDNNHGLILGELDVNGSEYVKIQSASAMVSSYTIHLPNAQGGVDTYLKNDGSGNLSWATVGSGGESNTASNLGAGSQIFASKVGVDLQLRSLVAGTNISLTQNANDITINATAGGLSYWTESEFTYGGKTGTKFTPSSANTNQSVVLQPKGTGAILANQPDGTLTGGTVRGTNAIDLQMTRYSTTSVASGTYSIILGGIDNKATQNQSIVIGGFANSSEAYYGFIGSGAINAIGLSATHSVIVGGANNSITANGAKSFIGGGDDNTISGVSYSVLVGGNLNQVSGQLSVVVGGYSNEVYSANSSIVGGDNSYIGVATLLSFIGGGQTNTINGSGSWAFIGGGKSNAINASGHYNFIGGGLSNNMTGVTAYSFIGGGNANVITEATYGVISGGNSNQIQSGANYGTIIGNETQIEASAEYVIAMGKGARGRRYGERVYTTGLVQTAGDNGFSDIILLAKTTDATPVEMFIGNVSNKRLKIPYNTTVLVKYTWIRRNITTTKSISTGSPFFCLLQKGATDGSITIIDQWQGYPTYLYRGNDTAIGSDIITLSADTTNGTLKFTATGKAASVLLWVCYAEIMEVIG